jgi:hypothetical protein
MLLPFIAQYHSSLRRVDDSNEIDSEGASDKSLDSVWAKVQTGPVEMPSQGVRLH